MRGNGPGGALRITGGGGSRLTARGPGEGIAFSSPRRCRYILAGVTADLSVTSAVQFFVPDSRRFHLDGGVPNAEALFDEPDRLLQNSLAVGPFRHKQMAT